MPRLVPERHFRWRSRSPLTPPRQRGQKAPCLAASSTRLWDASLEVKGLRARGCSTAWRRCRRRSVVNPPAHTTPTFASVGILVHSWCFSLGLWPTIHSRSEEHTSELQSRG